VVKGKKKKPESLEYVDLLVLTLTQHEKTLSLITEKLEHISNKLEEVSQRLTEKEERQTVKLS